MPGRPTGAGRVADGPAERYAYFADRTLFWLIKSPFTRLSRLGFGARQDIRRGTARGRAYLADLRLYTIRWCPVVRAHTLPTGTHFLPTGRATTCWRVVHAYFADSAARAVDKSGT
jgi:hypothetical protein